MPTFWVWFFAILEGIAGAVVIEEWIRKRFFKEGASVMTPDTKTAPSRDTLRFIAIITMVVSLVGFMISGCFWVGSIEKRTLISENQLRASFTNLQEETSSNISQLTNFLAGTIASQVNESEKFRETLMEVNHPNFSLYLINIAVGQSTNKNKTAVSVYAGILNRGAPSVTLGWRLKVTLTSGETVEAPATMEPWANTFIGSPKGTVKINVDNLLPVMYSRSPMPTGSAAAGWSVFLFGPHFYQQLNLSGVQFKMCFDDSFGVTTIAIYTNRTDQLYEGTYSPTNAP